MNEPTPNSPKTAADTKVTRRWLTAGDGIDALRLTHVPVPTPALTEVLVRIEALSLNYRDLLVVNGDSTWRPARPVVPISDAAGTVVALGSQVTRFLVGDRVSPMFLPYWRTGPLAADTYHPPGGPVTPGMLADYVTLEQHRIEAVHRSLDAGQAATLPIAALSAWHAVAARCQIGAGDRVLMHGPAARPSSRSSISSRTEPAPAGGLPGRASCSTVFSLPSAS